MKQKPKTFITQMNWWQRYKMRCRLIDKYECSDRFTLSEQQEFVASTPPSEWSMTLVSCVRQFHQEAIRMLLIPKCAESFKTVAWILLSQSFISSYDKQMARAFVNFVIENGTLEQLLALMEAKPDSIFLEGAEFEKCIRESRLMKAPEQEWKQLIERYPLKNDNAYLTTRLAGILVDLQFDNLIVTLLERVATLKDAYSVADKLQTRFYASKWNEEARRAYGHLPTKVGAFANWWMCRYGDENDILAFIRQQTSSPETCPIHALHMEAMFARQNPKLIDALVNVYLIPHDRHLPAWLESSLVNELYESALVCYYHNFSLEKDAMMALIAMKRPDLVNDYLETEIAGHRGDGAWFDDEVEAALWALGDVNVRRLYKEHSHLPYAEERALIKALASDDQEKIKEAKAYVREHPLSPLNEALLLRMPKIDLEAYLKLGKLCDVAEVELVLHGTPDLVRFYVGQLMAGHTQLSDLAERRYLEKALSSDVAAYLVVFKEKLKPESLEVLLKRGNPMLVDLCMEQIPSDLWTKFAQNGPATAVVALLSKCADMALVQEALIDRNEDSILWALINNVRFGKLLEQDFVRNVQDDQLLETYITLGPLSAESVVILLKRKNARLIETYIDRYPLPEGGSALYLYEEMMH